jgi:thiosulfate/3-mercaptopyruvate sulfurtransferase
MTRIDQSRAVVDPQRFRSVISASDLLTRLGTDDWCIVDCRFDLMAPEKGYKDFLAGHIPGSVHANLDADLSGRIRSDSGRHPLPDPETFAKTLGRWGISNQSQVIAYDYTNGAIAARLWWMLRWLGHADVAVLNGGLAAWTRAGGPIEHAELRPPRPIDPVAGHIPGAGNLPFSELLATDGQFLAADALRDRLLTVLGSAAARPWAAMCGSGVTACHLALAAEIAGIGVPRVYVGSWSEWIRDPGRPVATGAE